VREHVPVSMLRIRSACRSHIAYRPANSVSAGMRSPFTAHCLIFFFTDDDHTSCPTTINRVTYQTQQRRRYR